MSTDDPLAKLNVVFNSLIARPGSLDSPGRIDAQYVHRITDPLDRIEQALFRAQDNK